MIPFVDCIVCSNDLSSIESYNGLNITVENLGNELKILFPNSIPPALYVWTRDDGIKFYCFDEELLANYLRSIYSMNFSPCWKWNFWQMKRYEENGKEHREALAWHKYDEFEMISLFRSIRIYEDRYIIDTIDDIYSVPIDNAGYIIKNWIIKYNSLIRILLIEGKNLCPDLSAGLDTRSLSYFWRNLPKDRIYIHTKFDEIEYPIVQQLASKLGFDNFVEEVPEGFIGITGKGLASSVSQFRYVLDNYYKHYISISKWDHLIYKICPFLDIDFLKIKSTDPNQLKKSINLLLAKDYIDIPYRSRDLELFDFSESDYKEATRLKDLWGI